MKLTDLLGPGYRDPRLMSGVYAVVRGERMLARMKEIGLTTKDQERVQAGVDKVKSQLEPYLGPDILRIRKKKRKAWK
jgi:hypothetical protein